MLSVPPDVIEPGVGRRAEEAGRHRDDLELHLQDARVLERVQRVLVQVAMADLLEQVLERGIVGVVDEAERPAAAPVDVLRVSGIDLGEQLVGRPSVLGNLGWRLGHGR